jgi:hypothetical protein
MLLYINDNKTVGDLQDKFNECFQHLKIEFYDLRHRWGKSTLEGHKIEESKRIGEIRTNHNNGILEIKSSYKTGRVERDFHHQFGLNVQICFNKNNEWFQSVSSDDLTLDELNKAALEKG